MSDFYQEVQNLSERLRRHGHINFADSLDDAVASGSTGGEICMALRYHFREIAKDSGLDDSDLDLVKRMLQEVDELLKP